MDNFRTDQTVNVDVDLSREEIARLGATRPFWDFVSFPLEFVPMEDGVSYKHGAYSYPENGDYTEDVSKVPPLTLEIMEYVELDPSVVIRVEKILEEINKPKPKETYVSPFTGRVM